LEEKEKVIEIEIERLRDFKKHPFQVRDDKEMSLLKESIQNYGILSPLIVRPVLDGVYEIVAGHRRKYAAQQLGYRKLPVIIRVMSDDEAIISMVDSNLQRERISYSEKAFAYMMKNEAMKRKGGRKRSQIDHKFKGKKTVEIIGEEGGDSPKQVQRYIKITELIPELLQQLDDEMIGFNPAVEIASLKKEEQKQLLDAMDYAQSTPSLSQAQRMKRLSKEGKLTKEKMEDIMSEIKKGEISRVIFTNEQLHRYFPSSYTPEKMKREILAILKLWAEQYWEQ
jgi:ParB family chromosome partitioning protein